MVDQPPAKKKRVSFASGDIRVNQRKQSKVVAKDLVAAFATNRLKNWRDAHISEHVGKHPFSGRPGHVFYAMKSDVSDNVLHVGEPVGREKGVDHMVLIRDKTTGKVTTRPVRLVNFTPQWHNEPKIFLGEKAAPKIDYKVERGSKEGLLEQKRKLILEFGSARRQKLLAQNLESEQRNESMSSLMASVARVSAQTEEMEDSTGTKLAESGVALLRQAQSAVLPKANMEATDPKDVYKLEDIISPEQTVLWKEESLKFGKMSYEEKVKQGYPVFLADLSRLTPRDEGSLAYRSGALIYLWTLAKLSVLIYGSRNKRAISTMELNNVTSDGHIQAVIEQTFLTGEVGSGRRSGTKSFHIAAPEKDRLVAHQIVLVLLLGGLKFEIKPLTAFTGNTEMKIETVAKALGCRVVKDKKTKEGTVWATATLVGPPKPKGKGGPPRRFGRR